MKTTVRLFDGTRGFVDPAEIAHARHLLNGESCPCAGVPEHNGKVTFAPHDGGEPVLVWPDDVEER